MTFMRFLDCVALSILVLAPPVFSQTSEPFQREVYLMGTTLRISLYETDRNRAVAESEEMVRVIENAEQQLSTWKENSEVSVLNRQPVNSKFMLSPDLCSLMQKLQVYMQNTNGAFDPSIGRILSAWGIHHEVRIPSDDELKAAVGQSGFSGYQIDSSDCSVIKKKDVQLDTGGFGKGEALDRVLALAMKEDLPPFLLDFGGQLAVWKTPPGQSHWESSIADPNDRAKPSPTSVQFASGSLSTSSQSEQQVKVDNRMIGHIVDPRTGRTVSGFGSVTVWAKSGLEADILSTALFVMGSTEGWDWAVKHHVAAWFLFQNQTKSTQNLPAGTTRK